jgi:hypothetical protein
MPIPGACCSPPIHPADAKCCTTCCAAPASNDQVRGVARVPAVEGAHRDSPSARTGRPQPAGDPTSRCWPRRAVRLARAAGTAARRSPWLDPNAILRDLQSLSAGAPVVHEEYGVGRYVGLQPMRSAGDQSGEFLVLEYADGDRSTCRCTRCTVSRYTGAAPEAAPLHKLGTDQWAKARRDGQRKVRDVAAELLDLYAQRKARKGSALTAATKPSTAPSQRRSRSRRRRPGRGHRRGARDMTSPSTQPMDRVVCGDVGFGKTEVAMRAAFVAVQAGKQVVVLVPTTLLAQQHYNNFRDRFADWPVRIEVAVALPHGKASKDVLARAGARHGRHRHRHAPAAACAMRASRTWASSSSTRSTASACATRSAEGAACRGRTC